MISLVVRASHNLGNIEHFDRVSQQAAVRDSRLEKFLCDGGGGGLGRAIRQLFEKAVAVPHPL
jgi:hypothetical protein